METKDEELSRYCTDLQTSRAMHIKIRDELHSLKGKYEQSMMINVAMESKQQVNLPIDSGRLCLYMYVCCNYVVSRYVLHLISGVTNCVSSNVT